MSLWVQACITGRRLFPFFPNSFILFYLQSSEEGYGKLQQCVLLRVGFRPPMGNPVDSG